MVIIILRSSKDVFKRKFLLNSNDPLLSFCNLFPQKLQKAKISIKILIISSREIYKMLNI